MEKKLFFSLLRRFLRSKDVCQNKTQCCLTNNIDFCLTLGISLRVFFVVLVLACFFPSLSAFFFKQKSFFLFCLDYFFIYLLVICLHRPCFLFQRQNGRGLDPQQLLHQPPRVRLPRGKCENQGRVAPRQKIGEPCHTPGRALRSPASQQPSPNKLHLLRGSVQ